MNLNKFQFLGKENEYSQLSTAQYVILPVPYEGGVSYGAGAGNAPAAVLDASEYLECYDEVYEFEPIKTGVATLEPLPTSNNESDMQERIFKGVKEIVDASKTPIVLGGDHSISSAVFRALNEKVSPLSCIQIDAHSDLRDSYLGSKYSHASVMARIREQTPHALQLGIRSMSSKEAARIKSEQLAVFTMDKVRHAEFDIERELEKLPDPVFITLDVDALDWSVIWSTGTPEPGGFLWDEIISLLATIFKNKNVVGFDVVELAHAPLDRNSPFAVAKLIYKMIAMHHIYSEHNI